MNEFKSIWTPGRRAERHWSPHPTPPRPSGGGYPAAVVWAGAVCAPARTPRVPGGGGNPLGEKKSIWIYLCYKCGLHYLLRVRVCARTRTCAHSWGGAVSRDKSKDVEMIPRPRDSREVELVAEYFGIRKSALLIIRFLSTHYMPDSILSTLCEVSYIILIKWPCGISIIIIPILQMAWRKRGVTCPRSYS